MDGYNAVGTLWFWALMILILALHLLCMLFRKSRAALTTLSAVNMLLHLSLIFALLYSKAKPEELFFSLLLSTTAALFTTSRRKGAGGDDI